MSDNLSDIFYKICIKSLILELAVNGWTCNTQFLHDARDGNTAVFNGFLQYFALVRHEN